MNERILKLAKQAGIKANSEQAMSPQEQLFAQLIVQECMRQIEEQYKPVPEDASMMDDAHWKGYLHCGVDSVVAIKEHFGVEV